MWMECPRCLVEGTPTLYDRYVARRANANEVALLDEGETPDEDVLICLDCGCQFYGNGSKVYPHGVEPGDILELGEG